MLTKLVLLNSCSYQLAELDFSKGDSMQLVGSNNVGKSSLIYALNFLFLVNRNLMSFSGERSANKDTLAHYFPDPERSFIVFEIKKRKAAYCILVYRKGNGELRYIRFDASYHRALFFDHRGGSDTLILRTFKGIVGQFNRKSIRVSPFQQQQDILRTIYQMGRNNDAAVWLTKSNKTVGTTNSFSKVYRYLINSKLINNDALKDILLIADNRDQERLSYSRQHIQQIERLRMESQKMTVLRTIREKFTAFQLHARQVVGKYNDLCYRAASCRMSAKNQLADLRIQKQEKETELFQLREAFQAKGKERDHINRSLGDIQGQERQCKEQLRSIGNKIEVLLQYPPAPMLDQQIQRSEEELEKVNHQLGVLKDYDGKSLDTIKNRIDRLQSNIDKRNHERELIDDWLIFHLSDDPEEQKWLRTILHPDVVRLPQSALIKKVQHTGSVVDIFGGQFAIPQNWEVPAFDGLASLDEELKILHQDLRRLQDVWEASEGREAIREKRALLLQERDQYVDQRRQVEELAHLKQESKRVEKQRIAIAQEKTNQERQLSLINEQATALERGIEVIAEQITANQNKQQRIEANLRALDQLQLPLWGQEAIKGNPSHLNIEETLRQLQEEERSLRSERDAKNQLFVQLKAETGIDLADEEQFIESLEQELISIEDKERSIQALLDNIAVQFANPARKFLDAYKEFLAFIQQDFNRKLSEIQISNLESLQIELEPNERLQRDLHNIADLSLQSQGLFQLEEDTSSSRLGILQTYLEKGLVIKFSELFSLRLRLKVNGKLRTVDLGKQVESDGTDRMLRLVIIMMVISRLSLRTPDNRVVLFIDEIATIDGKNRPQLVAFCRQHHFYPIFAAPDFVDGFERYVMIRRNEYGQLMVEADKHYIDVNRQTASE